jgi:hypothetical protein
LIGVALILSTTTACHRPSARTAAACAKDLLMACNEGRYAAVESLMERTLLNAIELDASRGGPQWGGIKGLCNAATRSSTIVSIETREAKVQSELAGVTLLRRFRDGSGEPYSFMVVHVDGSWRVTALGLPQH